MTEKSHQPAPLKELQEQRFLDRGSPEIQAYFHRYPASSDLTDIKLGREIAWRATELVHRLSEDFGEHDAGVNA